jgi:acyl-coenzyme A thioesterase PaaI-like protein
MSDWDATERAAGALRGLNRAFNGVRIDDDALERLAVEIDALTARFATGTPRDKFEDMQTRPHLQQLYAGIDPFSIAGGQFHPASIGLEFRKESETSVTGTGVIDPMFAGPPERVHGGIQALVVDEVMGALNRMLGRQAFTARLTVNYRNPAPLGVPVTFRSWLGGVDGRKITLLATGEGPDGLFMEADGLFISRRPED